MISKLDKEEIECISELVDELVKSFPAERQPQSSLTDQIKDAATKGKVEVFISRDDKNTPNGFVTVGLASNRISLIYAQKDVKREIDLFSAAFESLKENDKPIKLGGASLTDNLQDHALDQGFTKYDRKSMSADRDMLLAIQTPKISPGYSLGLYDSEMREEVANLLLRANQDNIDVNVFPEFFGSIEACRKLIDDIENSVYGEWRESLSRVVIHNDRVIGIVFLTVGRENRGYIPEIAIAPEHRRRGLGRVMLLVALQGMLSAEVELDGINLDVTIHNPAEHLYKSLGFNTGQEYSIYCW
ncbi:MAG: GNAT family N-acetyltransferase [Candidatus Thorarchaeota archaeon]|jgi:ribosomal protein S18 acetylase RimI-like enzyme